MAVHEIHCARERIGAFSGKEKPGSPEISRQQKIA
jgi:hypothetical protein